LRTSDFHDIGPQPAAALWLLTGALLATEAGPLGDGPDGTGGTGDAGGFAVPIVGPQHPVAALVRFVIEPIQFAGLAQFPMPCQVAGLNQLNGFIMEKVMSTIRDCMVSPER